MHEIRLIMIIFLLFKNIKQMVMKESNGIWVGGFVESEHLFSALLSQRCHNLCVCVCLSVSIDRYFVICVSRCRPMMHVSKFRFSCHNCYGMRFIWGIFTSRVPTANIYIHRGSETFNHISLKLKNIYI